MDTKTFFEKFELIANAPDAITKMRELILSWATTGKLLNGNSNDWKNKQLGDVIELISGQHLLAHEHNDSGRGMPYLTGPSDFGDLFPNPTRWTESPKVTAQPGDILVTVKGSGVGKTNIVFGQETAISRQLMAVRVVDADRDFIYLVLKRAASHFQEAKTGIAIPGIGRKDVLQLPVVLPPLAEQKRIVAKVNELIALCDQLEAQQQEREQQRAQLNRAALARFSTQPTVSNLNYIFHKSYHIPPADLRKTILTLAVQGKLVPQDPNDEPGTDFISRIRETRTNLEKLGTIKKSKACREWSENEAPYEIPDSWVWSMLGEVTDVGTGSTPSKSNHDFWNGGHIPWVSSGSTSNPEICEGDASITEQAVKAHRLRLYEPGTLLVALYGQGKTRGQVSLLSIQATINQALAAICPIPGFTEFQSYIRLLLLKNYDEMRLLSAGGAQPNLNVQKIKEFLLPIPPAAEQRRIVTKVDQLMALVDQLEAQLKQSRSTATNLLTALVAELTSSPR